MSELNREKSPMQKLDKMMSDACNEIKDKNLAEEKERLQRLVEAYEKENCALREKIQTIHDKYERLKNQHEKLIGEIEAAKEFEYEVFSHTENLGDPNIHAMASCRLLGVQAALDGTIRIIKEMQKCD